MSIIFSCREKHFIGQAKKENKLFKEIEEVKKLRDSKEPASGFDSH